MYMYNDCGKQCRTGIKGPERELFDGGPSLNNIKLHILQNGIGKYTTHIIIYKISYIFSIELSNNYN